MTETFTKQQGFVLFTCLVLISLLALLVLSQMQLVLLQLKAVNHLIDRHRTLRGLETALRLIPFDKKNCGVIRDNPNDVKKEGCIISSNGRQYRFFTESLGVIPCLNTTQNDEVFSTWHWRLTISTDDEQPIFLQVRMATPVAYVACDSGIEKRITSGILSWRLKS